MNLWNVFLDPHRLELTLKDLHECSNVLHKGTKELCKGSHPCRSTPPHLATAYPPFTAGINLKDPHERSPALTCSLTPSHSPVVCLPIYTRLSSIPEGFNSHLPLRNYSCTSHALGLIVLLNMSSPRSLPHPHSPLGNGSVHYVISPERILLDVITGVDEGIMQEIPWESLPLTRVFVKERLALAAFFTCLCSSQAVVSLSF